MATTLPTHQRALVIETKDTPFHVSTVEVPQATPGSAVIRILHTCVLSYHREIFNGKRQYPFPTPLIGGMSAIGRIAALGHDSVSLKLDQLVYVDCVIRARDDPEALFLSAIHEGMNEGSKKLSHQVWTHGSFAEYAKMPLENCIALDEGKLCKTLGYSTRDLTYIGTLLVAYGGLHDIGVLPGETVVVCPATGNFGGAGVLVAVAMGANVIAMGRNEGELARLKRLVESTRAGADVQTVKLTGEEDVDTAALQACGQIDAVLDVTPPFASKSKHLKGAIRALGRGGRVSMMGFVEDVVDWNVMAHNITLKGKLMYEREDMLQFMKLLESGLFPKADLFVDSKSFGLEQWEEAFDTAAEHTGISRQVVLSL